MPTLRNVTAGSKLSPSVVRAASPFARMIGWLHVSKLAPQQGMWLQPCSAIHTLGMRTSIDVILLDAQSKVVALHPRVRPGRWWLSHRHAKSMIEMGPGFLDAASVAIGDHLALDEGPGATPA